MTVVNWTSLLSVGIDTFDKQHIELFQHINNFHQSLSKNFNKENLARYLKALTDYSVYHFSAEEELMQKYDFAGIIAHKYEHRKFIDAIDSYTNRLGIGNLVLSIEITNFLKTWIVEHICVSDMLFGKYIISKTAG